MKIQGAIAILPLVAMSMAIPLYVIKPMCILVLMFMTMLIFLITVEFIIMRGFMGMQNYPVVHVFIAMLRFMNHAVVRKGLRAMIAWGVILMCIALFTEMPRSLVIS